MEDSDKLRKFDKFWRLIESALYCQVPEYLKILLIRQGFDSVIALKELDDVDIQHMESFVRKYGHGAQRDFGDFGDYYPHFGNDPIFGKEFEVLRGHKRLLKEIVLFVKQQVYANGLGVFIAQCSDPKKTEGNYTSFYRVFLIM